MARQEFLVVLILFAVSAHLTNASIDTPYFNCPPTSNFTAGSAYQRNLNALFHNLSSDAASTSGFAAATSGQSPDQVQGLVLCRGDLSAADCANCISFATSQILQNCPNRKSSIVWTDNCLLRYSDQNFIGILDAINRLVLVSGENITDPAHFSSLLGPLMSNLSSEAIADPSGRLFAAGEVRFNDFQKIYGLVQCTRDISPSDCNTCLQNAISDIPNCCILKRGARVLTGSCTVRYETGPFFNSTAVTRPASPPGGGGLPSPTGQPTTAAAPPSPGVTSRESRRLVIIIASVLVPAALVLFVLLAFLLTKRNKKERTALRTNSGDDNEGKESLIFDLGCIRAATDNFSEANKLGQGGFGPVYKGQLPNGLELAVKRLSSNSAQGSDEFKNEVQLVAKLQHRNLVRLLGCCLEGNEKILVYEYMPNGSLKLFRRCSIACLGDDTILPDMNQVRQSRLDWPTRIKIINGIARGLLYLHEGSRHKIIHRDLKASNILLDQQMNAKISDFGTAKLVGLDDTRGDTSRIAGTYGYMSPEYAMRGIFSTKSDVFSFGVLMLEIVSGRNNDSFPNQDLPSYTWKLWRENRATEIVDRKLVGSCDMGEVLRCIHLGLLCFQEDPALRPTMSSLVLWLGSSSFTLAAPSAPALFVDRSRTVSN